MKRIFNSMEKRLWDEDALLYRIFNDDSTVKSSLIMGD